MKILRYNVKLKVTHCVFTHGKKRKTQSVVVFLFSGPTQMIIITGCRSDVGHFERDFKLFGLPPGTSLLDTVKTQTSPMAERSCVYVSACVRMYVCWGGGGGGGEGVMGVREWVSGWMFRDRACVLFIL